VAERIRGSARFIQRLAEGIPRPRLTDPIIGARPGLVVLTAPSGYGKTVLAAQIADSGVFPEVVWIDGTDEHGSLVDVLSRLLLSAAAKLPEPLECDALVGACCTELASWSDDRRLLLVVDNSPWGPSSPDASLLVTVMSEAPRGSVFLLTTRELVGDVSGAWVVTPEILQMNDSELRSLWQVVSVADISDPELALLVEVSGRHPALAALALRNWALADRPGVAGLHQDAANLIRSLVESQLTASEREVLDCAAVLGTGTAEALAKCCGREDAMLQLRRAATVLPLVVVSGSRTQAIFSVHQMVADALEAADRLAQTDRETFVRAVQLLIDLGEQMRALALALDYSDDELVACCLHRCGGPLAAAGNQRAVMLALGRLPAVRVATDARLLLLRAECCWDTWDKVEAANGAQLALCVAEADDDHDAMARSRLLLARIRAIDMDYEGVVAEVEPLVSGDAPALSEEARADAAVALLLAHTFLGDRDGLGKVRALVSRLDSSATLRSSYLVRLVVSRGIALGFLDGDWPAALDCFLSAQSRSGDSIAYSAIAEVDALAAMLQCGLVEQAGQQANKAYLLAAAGSDAAPSLRVTCVAASAFMGSGNDLREAIEAAVAHDIASGDTLSVTSSFIFTSEYALSVRDYDYALSLAERGQRAATSVGSRVLSSLAELVYAMALVASGDSTLGAQVAGRQLPLVEELNAGGHRLRARLVLAAAASDAADLAGSVEHLFAVADYIVDKSPILTVAAYLRAFPAMLGPLALAMGVDRIPSRVLNLLPGIYGKEALEQAAAVLTPAECKRLAARMRSEAKKVAERAAAADLSDAVCQVRVLGRMEVCAPHGPVADRDWCKRKARLLFAMLVVRAGTDVPRGEIIEYLWPEMDEDRALNNFYVVWSAMKRALAPNSVRETPCPFVEHVHGVCRIVPGRVVSDLDEFDAHMSAARKARERSDAAAELSAIRAAERVYRGDVLPGDIYDDWFAPVRSRYRHEFDDAMLRAAQLLEDCGEPHEGLSVLRRSMDNDVLREDFYQAALRLQIAAGQRSAAIETYMSCRSRLVEDLGIDPSRETTALYEQVLGMEDAPV